MILLFAMWGHDEMCAKKACMLSHFSHVRLILNQSTRLLCPWDSPGKNTGVGCHFLLQGIFPTQGLNLHLLCLLHWQANSLPSAPPGKPSANREEGVAPGSTLLAPWSWTSSLQSCANICCFRKKCQGTDHVTHDKRMVPYKTWCPLAHYLTVSLPQISHL